MVYSMWIPASTPGEPGTVSSEHINYHLEIMVAIQTLPTLGQRLTNYLKI
jgi:hypothetical protein